MFYIVYKLTNKINNKIYVGAHQTKDINDSYMGSGKHISRALKKYGKENFKKEVIKIYDNPKDMYLKEASIVNKEFVENPKTYNLIEGGNGGWNHIGKDHHTHSKEHMSRMQKLSLEKRDKKKEKEVGIRNLKKAHRDGKIPYNNFTGKKHSEDTKKKIGAVNSKKQSGELNSSYGSCWVYSVEEKVSKRISKEDLPNYISTGWVKGRKMSF